MKDQKLRPGSVYNQDFAKRKEKMSKVGDALSKVYVKRVTEGGLGAEPPAAGGCGDLGVKPPVARQFLEEITILMSLNYVSHVFRAI